MLLEVNNLSVHYDVVEALHNVSFGVVQGEIVTILGANGSGKTTLMHTISGIHRPTRGEIRFQDKKINALPIRKIVQEGISQVPEGRRIFSYLTVLENLLMGAYLREDEKGIQEDLDWVFKLFPILQKRQGQKGGSLSGGEQQMLAVGRGLMARPKLLLMDEPTVGLSPILCKEVARLISEINQTGLTILLVEQNARLALKIARRGYVMELGKILLQGEATELANDERVKHAYLGA
ncbi:MAG: ABC transporter ATP-binding protein [Deltaproteobacteria bacterium RBG_13_51_10]|nr:MAG: ABC transporter ATP-binding protein [Deltaproteobacteria bacterium RBG_13_51_10]